MGGTQSSTMPTHVFNVKMTCGGCSGAVTKVLNRKKEKGEDIKNFTIDMEEQTVSVETDMAADDMLTIVKKAGKETSLKETV
eukprot:m.140213 g.140213  ORF g.140213 m.140213 type:complete len:82 (+) comp22786_c0_seq1:122-367(+)